VKLFAGARTLPLKWRHLHEAAAAAAVMLSTVCRRAVYVSLNLSVAFAHEKMYWSECLRTQSSTRLFEGDLVEVCVQI